MIDIENNTERYLNYNQVLKAEFPERVQKISINAGFTCPNRDGRKGVGGCTYCNNPVSYTHLDVYKRQV